MFGFHKRRHIKSCPEALAACGDWEKAFDLLRRCDTLLWIAFLRVEEETFVSNSESVIRHSAFVFAVFENLLHCVVAMAYPNISYDLPSKCL